MAGISRKLIVKWLKNGIKGNGFSLRLQRFLDNQIWAHLHNFYGHVQRSVCIKLTLQVVPVCFRLQMGASAGAIFPLSSTHKCCQKNPANHPKKSRCYPDIDKETVISMQSWLGLGPNVWPKFEMECQMEQKLSGNSKFPGKGTTSRGWPKFSKRYFRKFLFHLILYRNFWEFWSNGLRPLIASIYNPPLITIQ